MNTLKYSLSSRQTAEYLSKADEITVEYRDHKIIPDLAEKYPKARINLRLPYDFNTEIDWTEIRNDFILSRKNMIIGIITDEQRRNAHEIGADTYHRAPIHTFQELQDMRTAGMAEVILGAPLFFQLDKIKRYFPTLKIRAVANVALLEGSMTYNDGICGTWIRPEDVPTYEPYIEVIEFHDELSAERALYRIYAEQKEWRGDINAIIKDIDHVAVNRMIPPTLAESRLSCGQRCMENGVCHLCKRTFDLANADMWRTYLANMENT